MRSCTYEAAVAPQPHNHLEKDQGINERSQINSQREADLYFLVQVEHLGQFWGDSSLEFSISSLTSKTDLRERKSKREQGCYKNFSPLSLLQLSRESFKMGHPLLLPFSLLEDPFVKNFWKLQKSKTHTGSFTNRQHFFSAPNLAISPVLLIPFKADAEFLQMGPNSTASQFCPVIEREQESRAWLWLGDTGQQNNPTETEVWITLTAHMHISSSPLRSLFISIPIYSQPC